jgi:hypothetical protein
VLETQTGLVSTHTGHSKIMAPPHEWRRFQRGQGRPRSSHHSRAARSAVHLPSRWTRAAVPRGKCSSSKVWTKMAWQLRRCDWWIWPRAYAHRRLTSSVHAQILRLRDCWLGAPPLREAPMDYRHHNSLGDRHGVRWMWLGREESCPTCVFGAVAAADTC